jgi:hypothetical protein
MTDQRVSRPNRKVEMQGIWRDATLFRGKHSPHSRRARAGPGAPCLATGDQPEAG